MVPSQLVHAGVVMLGQEIICDIPMLLVCSLHMTLAGLLITSSVEHVIVSSCLSGSRGTC